MMADEQRKKAGERRRLSHGNVPTRTAVSSARACPSSPSLSRTIAKMLEDSQSTGEINLSGRQLKEFPLAAAQYDLVDTIIADLSRNRFSELPEEISEYHSLELLNCHQNNIKSLPITLVQLCNLVYLDLSRNQLTMIPPFISQLEQLEVLLASNNKLVSLPEEIGSLTRLMQLDVGSNEISQLPSQLGDILSLRSLNIRCNQLVELPTSLCQLQLLQLDASSNRISHIPLDFRKMITLEEFRIDGNPLVAPPAHVCSKGLVHIMKSLHSDAIRDERRRGVIQNDINLRNSLTRRSSAVTSDWFDRTKSLPACVSPTQMSKPCSVVKHEELSRSASDCSPSDCSSATRDDSNKTSSKRETNSNLCSDTPRNVSTKVSCQNRQPCTDIGTDRLGQLKVDKLRSGVILPSLHSNARVVLNGTRETAMENNQQSLQKSECRPKLTDVDSSTESELQHRRQAAVKLRSEQQELMKQRLNPHHNNAAPAPAAPALAAPASAAPASVRTAIVHTTSRSDSGVEGRLSPRLNTAPVRPAGALGPSYCTTPFFTHSSFDSNYMNTTSETFTKNGHVISSHNGPRIDIPVKVINGTSINTAVVTGKESLHPTQDTNGVNGERSATPIPTNHLSKRLSSTNERTYILPLENELRRRHQILASQHRAEAMAVRQRFEKETTRTLESDTRHSFSHEGRLISSIADSDRIKASTLPVNCHKAPEAMSSELNSQDPLFTVRRNLQRAEDEMDQLDQLRRAIESMLRMKLPADLSGALKDGVVLCHLANHIRPRSVTSIHVPSHTAPKLSLAKCRRNVDNFLLACRRIGVDQSLLCTSTAVLDERGVTNVARTVHALIHCSTLSKQSVV